MRAYEIVSADGIDALARNERPDPRPGPRQILVRMKANAINYRDLFTILNAKDRLPKMPTIPNSDGAGEVVAVGPGVTRFKTGDRVAGNFFQRWSDGVITGEAMQSALGGAIDGVLAEQVVLEEACTVHIPDHLSYEQAATLPCAALTAWNSLVEKGGLKAGDTVLLLGTGGVSIFALQFAAMFGARAIITSSSDDKLERAKAMGAWHTINYRTHPDWEVKVAEATDGRGVDHVVEVGGPGTLARSIEATRFGGRIGLIGILTSSDINPMPIMRKSLIVNGVYVGSRRMFEDMNRAIAANRMEPVIDQVFAFDAARDAYHAMKAAGHFGKLVIRID